MGIKDIFKKKPKQVQEEVTATPLIPLTPTKHFCDNCRRRIYVEEGWTKNATGKYHRSCWKMMRKAAGI